MKLVYAALRDLYFHAKIKTTAEHTGANVIFIDSYEELMMKIREKKPDLLIVDLNGFLTPAHVSSVKTKGVLVVGYLSHVQTDLKKKFQDSCTKIMPQSEFSQKLSEILS
jgi:hypothetical protein